MSVADVFALPLRGTGAARSPLLRWRRSRAWQRFARNRLAVVCALFLVALAAVVLLAPLVLPYRPDEGNLLESLEGPSLAHPLGTDNARARHPDPRALRRPGLAAVGLVAVAISLRSAP